MRAMVSAGQTAALWKLYSQPRGTRGDASCRFFGASSLLFMTAGGLEKRATSDSVPSEVAPLIGKRSISRVLSGYFRDPDDHFSTSMVAHAL